MIFIKGKIKTEIVIDGMHCMHCAKKTEEKLKTIKGVRTVKIELENKKAIVTSNDILDADVIKTAISDIGFTVIDIK